MNWLDRILLRPSYASDDEAQFCHEWLRYDHRRMAKITAWVAMPWHVLIIVIAPIVILPLYASTFQVIHSIMLAGVILSMALTWFRGSDVRYLITGLWVFMVGTYSASLHQVVGFVNSGVETNVNFILIDAVVVLGVSIMQTWLIPATSRVRTYVTAFTLCSGSLAMIDHSFYWAWTFAFGAFVLCSYIWSQVNAHQALLDAQAEYRSRIKVLPVNYVLRSAAEHIELDKLFRPEVRYCVCISSDWRNYQKLSAALDSSELAEALRQYYRICQDALREVVPHKTYHLDWIADELFVVLYSDDESNEGDLMNLALKFAENLLGQKRSFQEQFGIPEAIDIGVSVGRAHVGMMGPSGNMKATALGEIPGRARRVQSAGKILRSTLGEADRIIFTAEGLQRISLGFDVKPYKLATDVALRDLDVSEIYYIEPEIGAKVKDLKPA